MIRITAKEEGFRRCGVAHSTRATDHKDDRFTKEELAILKAEPQLKVELIEDEGGGSKSYPMNAKDTVKAIQAATTVEQVVDLAQGDERASVLAAVEKRTKELQAPEQ